MSSARYDDSFERILPRKSPTKKKRSKDFDDVRVRSIGSNKSDKYKPWKQPFIEKDDLVDDNLDLQDGTFTE